MTGDGGERARYLACFTLDLIGEDMRGKPRGPGLPRGSLQRHQRSGDEIEPVAMEPRIVRVGRDPGRSGQHRVHLRREMAMPY